METPVSHRTIPYLPFQASTTLHWPDLFQKSMRLKTVRFFLFSWWLEHERKSDEKLDALGLYANVVRPAGVEEQSKLPVVVVSTCAILGNAMTVPELLLQVVLRGWFLYWRRILLRWQHGRTAFGRAWRTSDLRKLQLPLERFWFPWWERGFNWGCCEYRLLRS